MPEFKYTASDPDGVINSTTVIAENEEEVLTDIQRNDLTIINITELEEAKVTFSDKLFNRVSNNDKAQFLEYFASMLEAGLPVSEVLQAFYEDLDKPMLRKFVKDTQYGIRNGKPLSECFEDYPDLFPALYVGMIRVGEASGTLAKSLRQLADQLKRSNKLRGKVKAAMAYPAVLILGMTGVILVLMVVVFPKLEGFFVDAGLDLPIQTRIMIDLGKFTANYWYLWMSAIAGAIFFYTKVRKRPKVQNFLGRLMLRIPIFGPINKNMNVALFARTFGSLLESGVNILESTDVVQKSLSNQVYINIMDTIREDLEKGNTLADTMKKYPKNFSPFEIRVLYISDRTGTIAQGLLSVAEFYENKLFNMLSGLSSAIEPIILLAMGVVIAIIALSVITPIYQLMGGVESV